MRFLESLRALLQTWQGIVLGILAFVGAIYYGPRKMLETWDWYWERFRDADVIVILYQRKISGPIRSNYPQLEAAASETPYSIPELARILGRKESSVCRSAKRLFRRGKIEPYQDGWRLKT